MQALASFDLLFTPSLASPRREFPVCRTQISLVSSEFYNEARLIEIRTFNKQIRLH